MQKALESDQDQLNLSPRLQVTRKTEVLARTIFRTRNARGTHSLELCGFQNLVPPSFIAWQTRNR